MKDFCVLFLACLTKAVFVCAEVTCVPPLKQGGGGIFILLHETEIPLPRIYCHGRFLKQKEKWVKNAFFAAAAGEERGEIRTLALFHPPGSCSVSSVSPRFY